MITGSEIYWITRLDPLRGMMEMVGVLCAFVGTSAFIGTLIAYYVNKAEAEEYDSNKRFVPMCKRFVVISALVFFSSLFLGIAWAFTPSTKEMCAIKVIPVIANNKEVQELPNKVVELANEWMEELKPKKTITE